jgi:hypothetical protein
MTRQFMVVAFTRTGKVNVPVKTKGIVKTGISIYVHHYNLALV